MPHELDDDFDIHVQPSVLYKLHAVLNEHIPERILKPMFMTLTSLGLTQQVNNIDKKQIEQHYHVVQHYRDVPDEKGAVMPLDAPMHEMCVCVVCACVCVCVCVCVVNLFKRRRDRATFLSARST